MKATRKSPGGLKHIFGISVSPLAFKTRTKETLIASVIHNDFHSAYEFYGTHLGDLTDRTDIGLLGTEDELIQVKGRMNDNVYV